MTRFLTLFGLLLALTCLSHSQIRPSIPIIQINDKPFSLKYNVIEITERDRAAYAKTISDKEKQYEYLVSQGQISRSKAEDILESLRTTPLVSQFKYSVQFSFFPTHTLVSADWKVEGKRRIAWTFIEGSYAVRYGWSGGDSITLANQLEPFTTSVTMIPIIPAQLRSTKTFVDFEQNGNDIDAKMLCVSTTDERYFPAKLQFEDERLISATIEGIESWKYESYNQDKPRMPRIMTLERLFTNGSPEVKKIFTLVPSKPDSRTVDQLISAPEIEVQDVRTSPYKSFTYKTGGGTLTEQSATGVFITNLRSSDKESNFQLGWNNILIGLGLLVILGISIFKLLKRGRI